MNEPLCMLTAGQLAGAKAAEALREQGFDGRVVLAADWYDTHQVELLPGTTVTGIDRARR